MAERQPSLSTASKPTTNTRARSRIATRNRHFANIANEQRNFTGDIKQLPIIGKSHEGGVPFDSIVKRIVIYVMKEFKNGKDLVLVIEKQEDNFEKASRTKESEIKVADYKNPAKMLHYGKLIDIYFKREEIYKENLSKL